MDSTPAPLAISIAQVSASDQQSAEQATNSKSETEEPFSLSNTFVALMGLTIAIATIGVPFAAVLTDKPLGGEGKAPTASSSLYESKPSISIPIARASESRRRDSGWE